MSLVLVLLIPALGFIAAGLIAGSFYRYERQHHGARAASMTDDAIGRELLTIIDHETVSTSRQQSRGPA